MEWIEITAKSVELAKESALDELGIAADEAEFVILEEPRPGLFRKTRGTARVRARVAPRTPRAKTERRNRRSRGERDDSKRGGHDRTKRASTGAPASTQDRPKDKQKVATAKGADHDAAPRTKQAEAKTKKTKKTPKPADDKGNAMTMTLDDQVAATESFLTGLLEAIGFEGTIVTERTDEANAHVNIDGEDLGLLIGPRGNTMNAIQDLARINLQKQAAGSWEGHVHVDVNGYRAKRRAALVAFVEKVAADVRESGKPKALEPMSSSERKAVHDTVNGIEGVHTSSEGHEPRRWVMIVPDES